MQCRSHTAQLGRSYDEFRASGCEVLIILGDRMERARAYASMLHLPFPVLSDPERSIYHLYGLGMSLFIIQQTASVVVDREGVIRYHRQTSNATQWLSETRRLLEFVHTLPR